MSLVTSAKGDIQEFLDAAVKRVLQEMKDQQANQVPRESQVCKNMTAVSAVP